MLKGAGLVPYQKTKSPPECLGKKKWGGGGDEVVGETFKVLKSMVLVTKPLFLITGSWVIVLSLGEQGQIAGRGIEREVRKFLLVLDKVR